jgi:hypothetical protein
MELLNRFLDKINEFRWCLAWKIEDFFYAVKDKIKPETSEDDLFEEIVVKPKRKKKNVKKNKKNY